MCCQVEIVAFCLSLIQRNPTECGVSECHRDASTGDPGLLKAVVPWGKLTLRRLMSYIYIYIYIYIYDISSLKVNNLTLILLTWRK